MSVEILASDSLPLSLKDNWKEMLKKQSVLALTGSLHWYQMMLGGRSGNVLLGRDEDSSCRVLLPLFEGVLVLPFVPGVSRAGRKLKVQRTVGGEILLNEADVSDVRAVLEKAVTSGPGGIVVMDHVVRGGEAYGLIKEACLTSRILSMAKLYGPIPHYLLKKENGVFSNQARSSETRKKIDGRRRALEKSYNESCKLIEIRDINVLERCFDKLQEVADKSWQSKRLGHAVVKASLLELAKRKWLRVFLLTCGDVPVAYAECYEGDRTLVYEKIGYDPSFAKYSPGSILLAEIVDRFNADSGLDVLDFGEGDAFYKRQYSNKVIEIDSLVIFKKTCAMGLWFGFYSLMTSSAEKLKKKIKKMD